MPTSVSPDDSSAKAEQLATAADAEVTSSPSAGLPEPATSHQQLATYTRSQLALRNGQDRDEIWVAYRGQIYDVTRSRLWRRGNHYEHWAGQDLTKELDKDAPHTPNVFDRFPIIGQLLPLPPQAP